jgi:hypothetical protein
MASCCCWVLYRWWLGRPLVYRCLLGMADTKPQCRRLTTQQQYTQQPEGLSTLIFLENCYYHAQWSNQNSAVFLLNFRTVPSLTFIHKFPISLCPFLTLIPFSPFPLEKLENLEKLEILQDNTPLFTTFSFLTPPFFTSKRCQISLSMSARNLNTATFALPEVLAWKLGQPLGGSYEYPA